MTWSLAVKRQGRCTFWSLGSHQHSRDGCEGDHGVRLLGHLWESGAAQGNGCLRSLGTWGLAFRDCKQAPGAAAERSRPCGGERRPCRCPEEGTLSGPLFCILVASRQMPDPSQTEPAPWTHRTTGLCACCELSLASSPGNRHTRQDRWVCILF